MEERFLLAANLVQVLPETRIGCGYALSVSNNGFSFCEESRYRKGHRNPVITKTVKSCAMELVATDHAHAVIMLGDIGAHGSEVIDHRRNPVTFLDA